MMSLGRRADRRGGRDVHLAELTEGDAQAIARWHYPAPYDCYDSPGWDQMAREGWAICDAGVRGAQFRAVRAGAHGADTLAGYVRFRPDGDALVLHLGLRPDLCGRGLGREFLGLVVAEARRRAAGGPVTLLVRRFNARAIAAYRRAGFLLAACDNEAEEGTSAADPQQRLVMVLAD